MEPATDKQCTYIWTSEDNDRAQLQDEMNDFFAECHRRGAVVTGVSATPFSVESSTWYLASVVYHYTAEIVL